MLMQTLNNIVQYNIILNTVISLYIGEGLTVLDAKELKVLLSLSSLQSTDTFIHVDTIASICASIDTNYSRQQVLQTLSKFVSMQYLTVKYSGNDFLFYIEYKLYKEARAFNKYLSDIYTIKCQSSYTKFLQSYVLD